MAKFSELQDSDKIQVIKDSFIKLIGDISSETVKLTDFIKIGEKPKQVVAILEPISAEATTSQRLDAEERNRVAEEKAKAENARLEQEYSEKEANFKKASDTIAKIGKKEGCICGTCFNVDVANGVIAPELEPLIEHARKEAETQEY